MLLPANPQGRRFAGQSRDREPTRTEVTGFAVAGNGATIVGITRAVVNNQSFQRATYWQDGTFTVVNVPVTTHALWDINASGVYVGRGVDRSNPSAWRDVGLYGQGTNFTLLNHPDFPEAGPAKINDDNLMAGAYRLNGFQRPFAARAYTDEIYALSIPPEYTRAWSAGSTTATTSSAAPAAI